MFCGEEQRASKRGPASQTVNPSDGISCAARIFERMDGAVEVGGDCRLLTHPTGLDRSQPEGCVKDRARQPHPTNSGGKELEVLAPRADDRTTVGQRKGETFDMVT